MRGSLIMASITAQIGRDFPRSDESSQAELSGGDDHM